MNSKTETLIKCAVINNEADLIKKDKKWVYDGDSIDVAFLSLGLKTNVNAKDWEIIASIPYSYRFLCLVPSLLMPNSLQDSILVVQRCR